MTRSELIDHLLLLYPDLYHRDLLKIVTLFFDSISNALSDGRRVELRGFGVFSVRDRQARQARNPRTGAHISISDKRVIYFRSGKGIHDQLNEP